MSKVLDLMTRFLKLEEEKNLLNRELQEIAEYFQPEKASFFGILNKSATDRDKIFDSTPEEALELLAAALQTYLTNPATTWAAIGLVSNAKDASEGVKNWLKDTIDRMMAKFNSEETLFHSAVHELYMDLPTFGTGVFFIDEYEGVRCLCIPLSEVVIAENAKGIIDTVFRSFEMTARQIMQKWPDGASAAVRESHEKDPEKKFRVIHAVYPREGFKKDSTKSKELPIASVYFEYTSKKILKESGYNEMPYMVPRWSKTSGCAYGRGPGHKALPDVRVLNEMSRSEMIAIDKAADPSTILPHDGFITDFESDGGSLNYHRSQGDIREKIMTMGSEADLTAIANAITRKQDSIKRKFLNHKLQMVGGPQKTAEEVRAILKEGMTVLGPVTIRMQVEFLALCINRVFHIMLRNGELDEMPEELSEQPVRIQYISPISQAQKQMSAEAVKEAMAYAAPLLTANPALAGMFDFEEMIRDIPEMFGIAAKYVKSPERLKAEQKAQAQAQAKQQKTMDTATDLELAKKASEVKLNEQEAAA